MHSTSAAAGAPLADRPAAMTMEAFASAAACGGGVEIRGLAPFDVCEVWTRNSRYRITVIEPGRSRVLIEGGLIFSVGADATLCGATAGGSLLRVGCILPGFHLELLHAGRRIVTTAVRRISVNAEPLPGPF